MSRIISAALLIFITNFAIGQEKATTDFYSNIAKFDLCKVVHADSFITEFEGETTKSQVEEPLGFIGSNYQRFQIHFTSMVKSPANPYLYLLKGKTKVNNHICDFTGTISIEDCREYIQIDDRKYRQGYAVCYVIIYEDSNQVSAGVIKGTLKSNWKIDQKEEISYDGINGIADGFCNNQVTGVWSSYKTGAIKKCNWGDFRIPESNEFDIGAGDFSVNPQYLKYGWQEYEDEMNNLRKGGKSKQDEWWK